MLDNMGNHRGENNIIALVILVENMGFPMKERHKILSRLGNPEIESRNAVMSGMVRLGWNWFAHVIDAFIV